MLDEYLISYKIDFWRSVRNRSKQEHNITQILVMLSFVFFEVLLIEVVPRNGSGRVSQTDVN